MDYNGQSNGTESSAGNGMGRGMLYIAAISTLALLTFFFNGVIERQENPNHTVNSLSVDGYTEIKLRRNRGGHYVATGSINGKAVDFLVDTGATDVAIPGELAREIDLPNLGPATFQTANGISRGYFTRLESLRIGDIMLDDVRASVAPNLDGQILLGMSALGQLDWRQENRQLIIRQAH